MLFQKLFPQFFINLLPIGQECLENFLFHLLRLFKMLHIDHIIVDQSKIHIIDRYDNIGAAGVLSCNILLLIHNLAGKKTCQMLLQNRINGFCKLLVDGEIHIIPGGGILSVHTGDHLTHIIHDHLFPTLCTVQSGFHIGLDAALTHNIIQTVFHFFSRRFSLCV